MMFHALRQARTAIAEGIAATHRGGQPFGNLAATKVIATVHHCVYCYIFMEHKCVKGLRGAVGATRDRSPHSVQ